MFLVFSGRKGAGKDTICAELIKRNPDIKMVRVGLADYLKEICINLYGLKRDVCFGVDKNVPTNYLWDNMPWYDEKKHSENKGRNVTHREFLQFFGSEVCRAIDDGCWINSLLNTCKDKDTIYCITDVRFPSELEPLMEEDRKTIVLRLLRNPFNDNHQSETALNDYRFFYDELLDNTEMTIEESVDEAVRLFNIQAQGLGYKERLK